MASISAASSGVKNSNFGGTAVFAALCARLAADSKAGQFAETHAALSPVPARSRKLRRLSWFMVVLKISWAFYFRMKAIFRQGHFIDADDSNFSSKLGCIKHPL